MRGIEAAVRATPGVARVTPPVVSADRAAAMMIAYPTTSQQDTATNDMVHQLRDTVLPRATAGTGIRAYVGGPNAGAVDFTDLVNQRLPWLIGIVVGLSVLLLMVVFRSVTVALKAAAMNLLSISASYGVLTAVTQWGWLGKVFGFPEKMPVTTWVPMFLFVILFGLSMDYKVFLLSRIREEYDRTGDNAAAVARGLARTARVISAAAAIMVVVFLSVVLGATSPSSRSASAWRPRCSSTPPWCGSSWSRPSWNCSARPTGGCPGRSPGSCRTCGSRTTPWRSRSGFRPAPPELRPWQQLRMNAAPTAHRAPHTRSRRRDRWRPVSAIHAR